MRLLDRTEPHPHDRLVQLRKAHQGSWYAWFKAGHAEVFMEIFPKGTAEGQVTLLYIIGKKSKFIERKDIWGRGCLDISAQIAEVVIKSRT